MTNLLVFLLEEQRYAVPLHAVDCVLPIAAIAPLPGAPSIATGVINLHGAVVPVLDIRHRFGRPPRDYGLDGQLLIVRTPMRLAAFPVDEVVGVEALDARSITSSAMLLPGVQYVSGVVPTEDGLLFIHDVDTFLLSDEAAWLDRAAAARQI
ncbi:MAG: chemotaxis protein CheW [Chloroflexota bacterium]